MSAEYESSQSAAQSKGIMQKAKKNDSSNNDDDTLEDLAGSANNSIIGKVKSRVSSIIPSSFSKWFSPSARNNDSLNGSLNIGSARRRRRLEIEDDEEYGDDDDRDTNENENLSRRDYKENLGHSDKVNKDSDEDDTDNSEEDFPKARTLRSGKSEFVNEPPSKRSRISFDISSVHQSPLIASTPAVGNNYRSIISHSIDNVLSKPTPSYITSNFTEGNVNNNVNTQTTSSTFSTTYVPEVKPQDALTNRMNINEKQFDNVTGISSRRTLHLPSTSLAAKERDMSMEFSNLKRQSLGGVLDPKKLVSDPADTSTTITEVETFNRDNQPLTFSNRKERHNINGNTSTVVSSKKQKLNGIEIPEESNADAESSSESGDDCIGNNSELPHITNLGQRKTGLFNMSNINSQNGNKSRTSSFGNGINFYSHLEGRKSLFSGGINTAESANVINNSTLSLTSLNRRQFNASIYGSTAALSDSRLLNTFSPFYKGKTTYGGAAAYKKYNSSAGSNRICNITPTVIRPTSSLSTLSSSNNSLIANTGGSNALSGMSNNGLENTSAISSTAKRILDLINDFATPLSEAKKMANTSVKANLQILPQAKTRLNETDLQASRAMRLSQVRTPYSRPAVTLQPTIKNTAIPPPVKELQVPSISQLLQMKKMQSTTERSRQITMQSSDSATRAIVRSGEYKLPTANENNLVDKERPQVQQQQQQHTNKIKSKVRASGRVTASKNAANFEADEPPPPVNLPNIAFPLMQSVPKFDIALPKSQTAMPLDSIKPGLKTHDTLPKSQVSIENSTADASRNISTAPFKFSAASNKIDPAKRTNNLTMSKSVVKDGNSSTTGIKMNFKFSAPLTFECFTSNISSKHNSDTVIKKYTFSPPSDVNFEDNEQAKLESGKTVVSQLKSGSVLDALKKPFVLPSTTKEIISSSSSDGNESTSGFGDQFKKASNNKWECNTCLIRNESDVDKCVACETMRTKGSTFTSTLNANSKAPLIDSSLTLSAQFKKPLDEWECDVCMLRNKKQSDKCVACETVRKGVTESTSLSTTKWQSNSFGEAFKPKANSWECPTCLINNKSDCNECIACQTKKPGSGSEDNTKTSSTTITKNTTYTFGFSNVDSKSSGQSTAQPDSGFKSLAASQMSAKWECDACMTRNDAARNKCVCCEQAKPGVATSDFPDNGPKFTFGSAASSKFTFGFGSSVNGTTTSESGAVLTSVAGSNQKTEEGNIKSSALEKAQATSQAPPLGSGFIFGIKPTTVTSEKDVSSKNTENKDVADNGNNSKKSTPESNISGFKFGGSTASENNDLNTKPNFQFGVPATTATATVTSSPAVKFSFAAPVTSVSAIGGESKEQPNSNTSLSSKPATGGFSFGNSTTPATSQSISGFSFGTGTTTTTTTFTFGTSTSTTQPSQSSVTTTTSMSTATVKPIFSFGSNTTSTAPETKPTPSSITSTAITSTTLSAFSKPTVGFSFGTGVSGSATVSPATNAIFGSFSSPTVSGTSAAITSAPTTANSTLSNVSKNVFGTFGESSLPAKTTTTSATSTTAVSSANPFGSINQNVASTISNESTKPIASATMIFGSAGSGSSNNKTNAGASQSSSAPFVFGSSTSIATTQGSSSNTTTNVLIAAPAGWPKGGFAFGANSGTQNTNEPSKPLFGSFAPPAVSSTTGTSGSMFGNLVSSSTAAGANATFGSAAANGSTVSPSTMFGANTSNATPTTHTTQNLFGSVSTAPSSFGAPPTFGNNGNNTSNSTPTFGAASSATFGSFGSTASNANGDGASAAKKSEPAFNFGGNSSQIGSNSGFSFGMQASAPAAKPAFNFTASSAPAFNFTGSSSDAAKPFQFGATPPAPVFNFNSGAVEANTFSDKRPRCYAGSTKDPSTGKTTPTTVEQFTNADAINGVDQHQNQLTGQIQWSRQRNNRDKDKSNNRIPAITQKGENKATKTKYNNYTVSGNIINTSECNDNNKVDSSTPSVVTNVKMVDGVRCDYDINRIIMPQMKVNKYKYIRQIDVNGTQSSCNVASITGQNNAITGNPLELYKVSHFHEIPGQEVSGKRLVKRSIRIQQKFNRSKQEYIAPKESYVKIDSYLMRNQYRKVNFKSVGSIVTTSPGISSDNSLPSSPSSSVMQPAVVNQYHLMRCCQDNSELKPTQNELLESLPMANERLNTGRKACNSFIITKSTRATVATDVND
ncbi:nuclear pore complex protein Nup153 isoform X1 [Bactrocera dorsalis]|uniref:Nuclear pore complex protein Nup153 n=2 Tax=Bactrocera dorsalis TaxID=27457 RepID=A0ABM3K7X2_BACDO|nr:nuclear pore complex protein Nup153 isoform X1 [Bactrocera dorsalis]